MNWLKFNTKDRSTWPWKAGVYLVWGAHKASWHSKWDGEDWYSQFSNNKETIYPTHYMKIEPPTI